MRQSESKTTPELSLWLTPRASGRGNAQNGQSDGDKETGRIVGQWSLTSSRTRSVLWDLECRGVRLVNIAVGLGAYDDFRGLVNNEREATIYGRRGIFRE